MIPWTKITHFGDISVMTIAALAIAGWLLVEHEKRLALCWTLLFTIGMVMVTASKVAFIGWGIGIPALDFTGFSGHATRAAAVIPVLAYLLLQRTPPAVQWTGVGAAYGCAIVLGISRLIVHAHSPSEVVAGLALGAAISSGFILIAVSIQRHIFNPLRVFLVLLVLLPAPYVQPAPTQEWLTDMTLFFSGHESPYLRAGGNYRHPGAKESKRLAL